MIGKLILWFLLFKRAVSQEKVGDSCVEKYTGSTGICALAEDCPATRLALENNGIRPTFCHYTFDETIVCCRHSDYVVSTRNNIPPQQHTTETETPIHMSSSSLVGDSSEGSNEDGSKRVSERKCEEYRNDVASKSVALPTIIGGESTELNEFPHMVAIGWLTFEDTYSFKCGGTLISPLWVLSAGHCSRAPGARERAPSVVRVGAIYLDTVDENDPGLIPIESITRHPSYAPPLRYHDICLLKLARSAQLSAAVQPACLWVKEQLMHTEAVAIGWGVNNVRTRTISKVLQKVTLTLQDNEHCGQKLNMFRNRNWSGLVPGQLCAGGPGKDTCQGDSGAPLQVKWNDTHYVIGITSFGLNECASGRYAIYTRVSTYVAWIEDTVWPGE